MSRSPEFIPKVIHYCWFGGKEKPDLIQKCITSWKTHLPDYDIIEWNEHNVDISQNQYIQQAYDLKKYAFVSDYVRVHALYHYGGIYLDTDVEVFKSFDPLLHHLSFWSFEQENYIATSTIGAVKGNAMIKQFLDTYKDKSFVNKDGSFDNLTNVAMVTELFKNQGVQMNGEYQELEGLATIYPQTYFSPYDYINCRKLITDNSYAMHHFYKSWLPARTRIKGILKSGLSKVIGGKNIARIRAMNKFSKGENL